MAMVIGDANATNGMAKSIFDQVDAVLAPDVPSSALPDVQASWRKLSFAVAAGVTAYLIRDPANEPEFGEMTSSATDDPVFWSWLQGFVAVFGTVWTPAGTDGVALKQAVNAFIAGKPVPAAMKGSLK
jgi:hypothetical protein